MSDTIQIRFTTTDSAIQLPTDAFRLPTTSTPSDLTNLINSLTSATHLYTFVCNNILLQTDLSTFITTNKLSSEDSLLLHVSLTTASPQLNESLPHPDWVYALKLDSPTSFFSGCADGSIHRWENNILVASSTLFSNSVTDVACFMGEDTVNIVASSRDGTVKRCQVQNDSFLTLNSYGGHLNSVESLDISPDGSMLVTGCVNGGMSLFQLEDTENSSVEALINVNQSREIKRLEWKVEGSILAGLGSGLLTVFDIQSSTVTSHLSTSSPITGIDYDPSFNITATSHFDSSIRLSDFRSNSITHCFIAPKTSGLSSSCRILNPFLIGGTYYDGVVRLWDIRGSLKEPVEKLVVCDEGKVKLFSMDCASNSLVCGGSDSQVSVFSF
ncbi:hypothetical protein P9112_011658 [Eukaryota sp. TZLM1-RC]